MYLKAKEEELWKLKYYHKFTMQNIINLQKKSSKKNQNPSRRDYYNSMITKSQSFNTSQNIIIFQKSSYKKKVDLLFFIIT